MFDVDGSDKEAGQMLLAELIVGKISKSVQHEQGSVPHVLMLL